MFHLLRKAKRRTKRQQSVNKYRVSTTANNACAYLELQFPGSQIFSKVMC